MKKLIIAFTILSSMSVSCSHNQTCKDCADSDRNKYPKLTEAQVTTMAQRYMDLVTKHSDKIILQISLDGTLLNELMCKVENLKLIPIADDKDEVSMAMQFTCDGKASYNDMKLLFKKPLCPPPPACLLDTSHMQNPQL